MAAKSALTPGTAKTLKHNKWGSGEIKRHLAFLTMLLPGLVFLQLHADARPGSGL